MNWGNVWAREHIAPLPIFTMAQKSRCMKSTIAFRIASIGRNMNNAIKKYFAKIGAKGGKKSKRILTPEQARAMVMAREAKRIKK